MAPRGPHFLIVTALYNHLLLSVGGTGPLLLTNSMRQACWDVTSVIRLQKTDFCLFAASLLGPLFFPRAGLL